MTADRYVLVPAEPTEEMRNAAVDVTGLGCDMDWNGRTPQMVAATVYRAMIASAPPVGEEVRADLIEIALLAIDNVHDMDVSLKDYATAAVDAVLAHLAGGK